MPVYGLLLFFSNPDSDCVSESRDSSGYTTRSTMLQMRQLARCIEQPQTRQHFGQRNGANWVR